MIKGIYRNASAMVHRLKEQESIANNIANASTPGYKKDSVFVQELSKVQQKLTPRKSDWQTPMIDQVYTDFSQGSFDQTGASLDVAIEGDGFFVVQTEQGVEALMRGGSFTRDQQGFLTSSYNDIVQGDGGPIQLPVGDIAIADDGVITVDGNVVGRFKVATIENLNDLKKIGGGKFQVPENVELSAAARFVIRQGYLESSNVNVITQMVEMISSYRNYEADANSLKTQDQSLGKLISEVGRAL